MACQWKTAAAALVHQQLGPKTCGKIGKQHKSQFGKITKAVVREVAKPMYRTGAWRGTLLDTEVAQLRLLAHTFAGDFSDWLEVGVPAGLPGVRMADDGELYTRPQFLEYYGEERGMVEWVFAGERTEGRKVWSENGFSLKAMLHGDFGAVEVDIPPLQHTLSELHRTRTRTTKQKKDIVDAMVTQRSQHWHKLHTRDGQLNGVQLQKELDCMREALTTRAKALRLDKVKGRELACPLTVAVNQGRLHVCQRMLQEFTARMKTWYINEYGDDE